MSTKSAELRSLGDWVFEKDCAVCSAWPRAERAQRRIDGDYVRMPLTGTCARCLAAFWQGICVTTKDEEETNALRKAIREDRRKGNPRPNGHQLLKEIRSKAAKH